MVFYILFSNNRVPTDVGPLNVFEGELRFRSSLSVDSPSTEVLPKQKTQQCWECIGSVCEIGVPRLPVSGDGEQSDPDVLATPRRARERGAQEQGKNRADPVECDGLSFDFEYGSIPRRRVY
ncbi:hypothetical protein NL676_014580 [Syzygium grande]|nr:hypothetical protein NL676_014580 [Syzygium grande]